MFAVSLSSNAFIESWACTQTLTTRTLQLADRICCFNRHYAVRTKSFCFCLLFICARLYHVPTCAHQLHRVLGFMPINKHSSHNYEWFANARNPGACDVFRIHWVPAHRKGWNEGKRVASHTHTHILRTFVIKLNSNIHSAYIIYIPTHSDTHLYAHSLSHTQSTLSVLSSTADTSSNEITFYDSVTGKPLFVAVIWRGHGHARTGTT